MPVKVLLADDNITAQRMGSKILSDAGYAVVAVSNGAAAVKKIASERPEVIILDVYMPGYTGLEVCEKVKSAAETARVPVLLTVTSVEPFSAEDGNRVKADGVLIKPFEPTDLLAVMRKLEEKLHPAPAAKEVAKPEVEEVAEPSEAELKPETAASVPSELAAAPVMLDDLSPSAEAPSTAVGPFVMATHSADAPDFDVNAPAPAFDLEHVGADPASILTPPAELEYTSAPQSAAVEVGPAPELEITAQENPANVIVTQEPGLATDPSDFAEFTTKFGQEHPEDIPVGIAIQEPPPAHDDFAALHEIVSQLEPEVSEPEVVAEPAPEVAPEASVETSAPVSIEQEMQHAMQISDGAAAAAVAPAPEPAPEPEPGLDTQPLDVFPEEPPAAEPQPAPQPESPGEITRKLVAQFAAELEAAQIQAPPETEAAAVVERTEDHRVAEAVDRVLERYKGELIAAIVRELKQ